MKHCAHKKLFILLIFTETMHKLRSEGANVSKHKDMQREKEVKALLIWFLKISLRVIQVFLSVSCKFAQFSEGWLNSITL